MSNFDDDSTSYGRTPTTPPWSNVAESLPDGYTATAAADSSGGTDLRGSLRCDNNSSVPSPGGTFIIRAVASGKVLTLVNGGVEVASPGPRGSIYWDCEQTKGWLGFRNAVSGNILGHDKHGRLGCQMPAHQHWGNFCVRPAPGGVGYLLLMTHWDSLWCVGFQQHEGREMLAKLGEDMADAVVWDFVRV
ncbi:uncharacterized protein L3040_002307 [Drepanopeziza brunnea f. sp. 'multigermtubi']|uniref:Uncharacterized protein n=1 Tax=Marssonina brunnea f. sp. multigermtubi (strain MB_m1) TaxID=1072389 RepID=K1X487_MARBU|nr:uncharacterized protein MBM_01968 [Drepanopeziza brunnea f. sp. 'multigermtubi' MB_m1]EKD20016.1 hypothetical protein MBM_01968 [Drepanopeziza brunnea f. sp. 'multigermtubi' MB_m1]KAJ5050424.1 hypothetical protein L3040_002307 [Drepanopeziza brunnea f. sp. 'multigermtubi']